MNLGPTDYESAALTAELRALRKTQIIHDLLRYSPEPLARWPPYSPLLLALVLELCDAIMQYLLGLFLELILLMRFF